MRLAGGTMTDHRRCAWAESHLLLRDDHDHEYCATIPDASKRC